MLSNSYTFLDLIFSSELYKYKNFRNLIKEDLKLLYNFKLVFGNILVKSGYILIDNDVFLSLSHKNSFRKIVYLQVWQLVPE